MKRNGHPWLTGFSALLGLLFSSSIAWSQSDLQVETVIDQLKHPFAVAVQPQSDSVFVSESGAGRVIQVANGKAVPVVTGFPQAPLAWSESVSVGPMGLRFVSPSQLVVGWAGNAEGAHQLQTFEIAAESAEPLAANEQSGKTLMSEDDQTPLGLFYGITSAAGTVYFSTHGDESNGWIGKATLTDGQLGDTTRFIATTKLVDYANPTGLTISPEGFLVVSQMGALNAEGDSQLSFYEVSTGELKANFATGLVDMMDIAYGPNAGRLFAVDIAWNDQSKRGLYKLIGRENFTKCIHEQILELPNPTSLAFDSSGNLFVTVLGNDLSADSTSGKLLKISGLDVKQESEESSESDETSDGDR